MRNKNIVSCNDAEKIERRKKQVTKQTVVDLLLVIIAPAYSQTLTVIIL